LNAATIEDSSTEIREPALHPSGISKTTFDDTTSSGQHATQHQFPERPTSVARRSFALAHSERLKLAEISHSLVPRASDDASGRRLLIGFRVQRS
jgi:hypothetical protein